LYPKVLAGDASNTPLLLASFVVDGEGLFSRGTHLSAG
jgi:hypothetical protein